MSSASRPRARSRPSLACVAACASLVGAWGAPAHAEPGAAKQQCMHSYEEAQRVRLDKKLRASRRELLVCARAECPDVLRRDCAQWLAEVEKAMPSVVVVARAAGRDVTDVEVYVDDELLSEKIEGTALSVDPGEHVLRFESNNRAPIEQKLVIAQGEKNRRIEIDFGSEAPARQRENLVPVYGLGAIGAIGLTSFVFFGLRSHSRKQDLEACKGHCPQDDVNAVRRDQIVADVSLGLGLVALGGAAWLYFGGRHEAPRESARFELGVAPTPGGATLSLGGRY